MMQCTVSTSRLSSRRAARRRAGPDFRRIRDPRARPARARGRRGYLSRDDEGATGTIGGLWCPRTDDRGAPPDCEDSSFRSQRTRLGGSARNFALAATELAVSYWVVQQCAHGQHRVLSTATVQYGGQVLEQ